MTDGLDPHLLQAGALLFGLIVGSFLNVVIHRLPIDQSIVFPASRCPECDSPIAPFDNVPLLSYLWLRGRCRSCRTGISVRYPAVELLTGCVFLALMWRLGPSWLAVIWMIFAAGLIAAALIDIDHQLIPDEISLGGLAFGLVVVPWARSLEGMSYVTALYQSGLGALIGAGALWSVAFVHARLSVATGRHFEHWPGTDEDGETLPVPTPGQADYWLWFPGLGLGDVKLLAMIGAFVGPFGVLDTILFAALIGLVIGLVFAVVTRSWNSPFGFGPAIAAGALLTLFLPRNLFVLLQ